jgi:hypothetical protein
MNTIAVIKKACEQLDVDVRSYSGRGMYGKECVGFVVSRGMSAAQFAFSLALELSRMDDHPSALDAVDDLRSHEWRQDSLGMDTIVYVPRLRWEDPEEGADEEEENTTSWE